MDRIMVLQNQRTAHTMKSEFNWHCSNTIDFFFLNFYPWHQNGLLAPDTSFEVRRTHRLQIDLLRSICQLQEFKIIFWETNSNSHKLNEWCSSIISVALIQIFYFEIPDLNTRRTSIKFASLLPTVKCATGVPCGEVHL